MAPDLPWLHREGEHAMGVQMTDKPDFTHADRILAKLEDAKIRGRDSLTASHLAAEALSIEQRAKARRTRTDALQTEILSILRTNPSISWKQVLQRLEAKVGEGVVVTITDYEIQWTTHGGALRESPIAGLKNRVSRAKKILNSL
jgi:hypothetical protein